MTRANRDSYVAVFLLLFCGVFLGATFYVEDMGYESMGSEVWPQLILIVLFVLTLAYLFQSMRMGPDEAPAPEDSGFKGWLHRYRNALWCYALFFVFLVTLPWLGMLLGGVLFVFAALTVLGNRTPRDHAIHAAIALGTMSGMWAIFTFGLKVFLPAGEILPMMY
ncbi:MAG: tripartite tricarboxylate transporter TctB family protein [Rhodospirillales bacterium]|jgi:putative tricarboxylic transport membrane protein|nr:tripartite tricarboxylate transporter TctB family protein [Rhodospirillales bacterium]